MAGEGKKVMKGLRKILVKLIEWTVAVKISLENCYFL